MNFDFTKKRAVVCGSTQGIGYAIAMELASLGAEITLVARDARGLEEVKSQLSAHANQNHKTIQVDFTNADELKEELDRFVAQNPACHILVNNTGGPPAGLATEATTEAFYTAFTQHLICNHLLVQAFLPGMKSEKFGRIINVISTSIKEPIPGLGVSNTVRGAVAQWSKTLAYEVGPFGITVNNILPGATKTKRLDTIFENKAKRAGKTTDVVAEEMRMSIPLRRFAEPQEIAYATAFLASESAGYISGINLPVDGGRLGCL